MIATDHRLGVDLRLDQNLGRGYRSPSQVARRVTEAWAERNLYCVACPSDHLVSFRANTKVMDLRCERCGASFQLKSLSHPFGRKVTNSAYEAKMAAIEAGKAPHYGFLQYSRMTWTVGSLFVVPGHFLTPALVERRKALRPTANRAGWVGSNILLHALPGDARVQVVVDARPRPRAAVRSDWKRFAFLARDTSAQGGWGADVLRTLRVLQAETGKSRFTLQAYYARFEGELAALHPQNRNVRAKVRQQLQVLRDGGVLRFEGRGRYEIVK